MCNVWRVCNIYRTAPAWLVEGQCPIIRGERHDVTTRLYERARCQKYPPLPCWVALTWQCRGWLLAVLGGAVVSTTAAAQEDNTAGDSTTVRIVARKLDDGRIEFGLQQRQTDNTWGDRQRPRVRFFPTTATVGTWLVSSTLTLTTPQPGGESTGRYSAVTAGLAHSCGVRTDGTITCWGEIRFGKLDVPDGQFSAVTAGTLHSCGLRTNGTITCWGEHGPGQPNYGCTPAPSGQFSAVSAGELHSCGLRTDGTITCWGLNAEGQLNTPAEQFSAVTAGTLHSCGLRTNGTITCWGNNNDGRATAPDWQPTGVVEPPGDGPPVEQLPY